MSAILQIKWFTKQNTHEKFMFTVINMISKVMNRSKNNNWRSLLKSDIITTKSFIEILTINFRLLSTNEKSLTINIIASEDDTVMKMSLSSATYLCHLIVLTQSLTALLLLLTALLLSLTAVLSLLTVLDKDSDTFSYYSLATKDLSQDKMTF